MCQALSPVSSAVEPHRRRVDPGARRAVRRGTMDEIRYFSDIIRADRLASRLYELLGTPDHASPPLEPQAVPGIRPDRRGGAVPRRLEPARRAAAHRREPDHHGPDGAGGPPGGLGLPEGITALRRLEARHLVLRDPAYVRLFAERARAIVGDLAVLDTLVSTPTERQTLVEVTAQLQRYQALAERPTMPTPGAEVRQPVSSRSRRNYCTTSPDSSCGGEGRWRASSRWRVDGSR